MYKLSVAILIVTYNSENEILELLGDVQRFVPYSRVIIIDNDSKDDTVKLIKKHFQQVKLIENSENIGYARAVNQGFSLCKTEYVMLLNPDIRITCPQVLTESVNFMRDFSEVAVSAPLQFKDNGSKQYLNFTWSYLTFNSFRIYLSFLFDYKIDCKPIQVQFLNAGCLLIRNWMFEHVGKFNEQYFLYGEEPDLFLKFMRSGYKCYLLPALRVIHYRERSMKSIHLLNRVRLYFRATRNVTHALITGYSRLLRDRLVLHAKRLYGKSKQTIHGQIL